MPPVEFPPLEGSSSNANDLLKWIQDGPQEEMVPSAQRLFEKLLANASQPRGSTADACVKLCGFVQLCAKSQDDSLKQWAFSEKISQDMFNFFIEWNEKDQHRSMRLVLDLLSFLITQNPVCQIKEDVKADLLRTMVAIIARNSTRPLVKSCITALNHLLTKSVLTLEELAQMYQSIRPDLANQPAILLWQEWVAEIFRWMELPYVCPVAGKLLGIVISGLYASFPLSGCSEEQKPVLGAKTIRRWLETALSANPDLLESPEGTKATANTVELDSKVLERYLLHNSYDVRSFAMSLLITSSSSTRPYSLATFELLRKHLRSCYADPDAKFRNEILGHSKNMVKRIKGAISILEKDIARIGAKASTSKARETAVNTHISKGAKEISNAGEAWLRDTLKFHEEFFGWYLRFLRQELSPTASYQRHITALKALVSVLKLGKDSPSAAEKNIYKDAQWIRIIMDLIMDPFDDVRETATSLLMLFPPETTQTEVVFGDKLLSATPLMMLKEFSSRAAAQASRTSRADHSDGAARSYGLLCAWENTVESRLSLLSQTLDLLDLKVSRAEKDLGHAVMAEPVHGDFAAIRYMWEVLLHPRYSEAQLQLLAAPQTRIVDLCTRIWDAVSYVLCDDSPEGKELEDEDVDSKGLLSYSFRAIHESSNLMRTIVGNLSFSRMLGALLPTPEVFRSVGDLAFSQLSTLRHRGAFSSVSLNFICCCQNARNPHVTSPGPEPSLLENWYKGALACIYEQRSTTRRSAGIPALITAILASNADSPSFEHVMRTLEEIAQRPAWVSETDGSSLPQVHAFNSLKEVFKSSLLSKKAERYLPECLQLATNSLKSEVWAIRNCALLLLRSLLDSLFGTNESKSAMESGWDGKTLRISYTKYPSLPPILLNLLQSGQRAMEPGTLTSSSAAESVFPALDIIRRAGPPESHRDELYKLITRYLGSQQWHVREIAARTLCSFLLNENWLSSVKALLDESRGAANRLHGTFLTIKFLLERTSSDMKEGRLFGQTIIPELNGRSQLANFAEDIKSLSQALQEFEKDATICSEVWAAFVEIRTLTWESAPPSDIQASKAEQLTHVKIAQGRSSFASTALLDLRLGIRSLREAVAFTGIEGLRSCLFDTLDRDTDTALMLLEVIPTIWGKARVTELCTLYLDTCKHTKEPEARAIALTNLAVLFDDHITQGKLQELPKPEELESFQQSILDTINPALANAVLLASGSVMGIQTLPHNGQLSFFMFEQRLRAWGKAVADALHDSNTFDMRMAAAKSIKSFAAAVRSAAGSDAAYLPFLLALYNTLVDDDDEIRDVGALATALVTSPGSRAQPQPLVAVDAADALLSWIQRHFGQTNEFKAYVACRLVGDPLIALDIGVQDLSAWTSPEQLFAQALEVDESLFAVEEQNLFIDEVRETERWAEVFRALPRDFDEIEGSDGAARKMLIMDSSLTALKGWVEKALEALAVQAGQDDGPLGWASTADAFALCHRVLVCGKVMVELLGEESGAIDSSMAKVKDIGQTSRLHGLLLSTLDQV
ncbi:hypothetical protein J7T55_009122 [Diaporthe amygdali]|uniref:uncharacterized protein n=1 Tax=Phomopsis amygdali TaxID=1214568 RepID=UPI0022FEDE92|nr:uncharacterized protein J7T55_009122 [Diaporthe amygdali]KAJ0118339.1 hypothetical protein J7T55_009122 [Diaporthe amygdali]